MAAAGIKINILENGSCFNWVEEVEREDPSGWWSRFETKPVERPVRVKKEVRLKKEVKLKKETTYPYWVPLSSYLESKMGTEAMKQLGFRDRDHLEQWYMTQIRRDPGVCRNPEGPKFRCFDVEKLDDESLKRLIRGWESGLKIVTVGEGHKAQRFVELRAMNPNSCPVNSVTPVTPVTTKEEASQDKGFEKEVNNP